MRFFQAFLIIFVVAILFMLPFTEAVYDFRTDVREDSFTVSTGEGVTTGSVVLLKCIYDDDTTTLAFSSNLTTDSPLYSSYNSTTRAVEMSGLTANTSRTITVDYDVAALSDNEALDNVLGKLAWIWMLCLIALAPAALVAIFTGRI